jgi:predicted alpha/beta superfamily hydrolase
MKNIFEKGVSLLTSFFSFLISAPFLVQAQTFPSADWKKYENSEFLLTKEIDMPQFETKRRIWVSLPLDYYTNPKQKYAVIYLHDGQNLFKYETSFAGSWGVEQTLQNLQKETKKGIIAIGIDNGSANRIAEYTAWKHPKHGGGEGAKYVDFLVKNLKPLIDKSFRTLRKRENTAIAGSSLGGLISFYAGLQYPKVFGKIGIFSPSFWYSEEAYTFAQNFKKKKNQPFKVCFLAGEQESKEMVPDMQRMYDIFLKNGFSKNEMQFITKQDGKHQEWFWKRELPDALRFLMF